MGGGGGAASSIQWHPYIYIMYILYVLLLLSLIQVVDSYIFSIVTWSQVWCDCGNRKHEKVYNLEQKMNHNWQ